MIRMYRKRPIAVAAVRWTGDNEAELMAFAGDRFSPLYPQDAAPDDDPQATAQVFDRLHSTRELVYTGDWIIRGVHGEFYPCRPRAFEATYELVPDKPDATSNVTPTDLDTMTRDQVREFDAEAGIVIDTLDEWLHRAHGITSSAHHVGMFLEIMMRNMDSLEGRSRG